MHSMENLLPTESDDSPMKAIAAMQKPRPAPQAATPLSNSSIRTLWVRMAEIYGLKWTKGYGEDPNQGAALTWAKGLAGIAGHQLAAGLSACIASADPWPPSLPEFRLMCLGIPSLPAVRLDVARSDPFSRLVWQYLDGYRFKTSSAEKADRLLQDAYELAREFVMRGGALPAEPAGVLDHPTRNAAPKPASPEAVRQAEQAIAEMFGRHTVPAENDDERPRGKMAAAGLDP